MRHVVLGILFGTGVLACAPTAVAQGIAGSFRELQLLVRAGETVTVTDVKGHDVKGRIDVLSPPMLVITDRSGRHEWTEGEVASIRQLRGDSLGNGALIGLGIGTAFGLVGGIMAAQDEYNDDAAWVVFATGVYAGIGTGIGVGIDALIRRETVIYQPATPRTQVRLLPLLTPRRQGVLVSIGF